MDYWNEATKSEQIFINPNFPPYDSMENFSWITIISREMAHQTAFTNDGKGGVILSGDSDFTWKFLAPEQIQQSIVHVWEPWETIASKLAGTVREYQKISNEAKGLAKATLKTIEEMDVSNSYQALSQYSISTNSKVDTPLVYQDTERLKLDVTVNLSFNRADDVDIIQDLMNPVITLQRISSPILKTTGISSAIGLPHAFQVKIGGSFGEDGSEYGGTPFIFLEVAALLSVQPTWMGPYSPSTNYPTRCELTLSFISLKPTYSNVWDDWVYKPNDGWNL